MTDQFLHVPLAEIAPSLTNPRTSFNEQTLAELAEDIKARGVDSPITLRPLPGNRVADTDRKVKYEIVFGERRYRASQQAGVPTIPARVRDLTDGQALVAQLVENLDRDDITALEEAEGIHRLMDAEQLNADQVADRLKKSRRHVYNRLKLLDLCIEAKDALRTGLIDSSRGILIARIPDNKLQLKALKEATTGDWQGELPSVRDLSDWIRKNVMLDLERAVFKITDARLVEAAGSCTDCPKRTGANPDLFHDVEGADICTDPGCFHQKEEAHRAQLMKKAEARGLRIVEGKEALELLDGRQHRTMPNGYVSLSEQRPDLTQEGERPATLAQALGKDAPSPILFIHPRTQEAVELVNEDEAEAVLLAKGLIKPEAEAQNRAQTLQSLEEDLKALKEEMERKTLRATHDQLYNATLAAIHATTAAVAKVLLTGDVLRAWLLAELDMNDPEDMAQSIGLELKDGDDEMDAVTQRIHRMGDTELLRAAAGHMLRADLYYTSNATTPVLDAYVKGLGVDAKAVKQVAAKSVKAAHAAELKAIQDKIDAQKQAPADAPAAQATRGAGGKPKAQKTTPAAQRKTTPEEAQRGIAAAMQGIEGSASAPKGAVAPPAAPAGKQAPAWPWPKTADEKASEHQAAAAKPQEPADPVYKKARALVLKQQEASVRLLKEELGIGTTKAMGLMASLEAAGVIGPAAPRQPREVLLDKQGNARVAA